jgi:methyl halide transferase
MSLDQTYWNTRYQTHETGWDLGEVSPPLKAYFDQLTRKDLRILIVGCGNAYEANYLLDNLFTNITLLDIAPLLVEKLQQQYQDKPQIKVLLGDFFAHQGEYDLIVEQTFFCALSPTLRPDYAAHTHRLLSPNGHLVGVLFDREFPFEGPPFGGNEAEYRGYFAQYFELKTFEKCYNSIKPRAGTELFINLTKI